MVSPLSGQKVIFGEAKNRFLEQRNAI